MDPSILVKQKTPFQLALLFGEATIYAAAGGILYIVISRFSGPELLGQYSLIFAWFTLFQAVGSFGIPEFLLRELAARPTERSDYLINGLFMGFCISLVSAGIMTGLVGFFDYTPEIKRSLYISALVLMPMTVNAVCRGSFLVEYRAELALSVASVESLVIVSINTYHVLSGLGVGAMIITVLAAKMLSSLISLYLIRFHSLFRADVLSLDACRKLLPPVTAFALSNLLGVVANRANLIMLSWWADITAVGLYAAASKLLELALMIPNVFAQILLPRAARTFSRDNALATLANDPVLFALFAVVIPAGIGAIYFAESLLVWLFGDAFSTSAAVLQILMVFLMIEAADAVMGVILKATGRQRRDVQLYAFNPIVNISLNALLIPTLAGLGAALAKLAGIAISSALRARDLIRHGMRIRWIPLITLPLLVSLALIGASSLLQNRMPSLALVIGYVMLSSATLVAILRNR